MLYAAYAGCAFRIVDWKHLRLAGRSESAESGRAPVGAPQPCRQLSALARTASGIDSFLRGRTLGRFRLGQSLWRVCSGKHSLFRKERRGLWMALVVGGIYAAACGVLAWGPWGIVRNVIGTLEDSPLAKGIWCVISLGMSLMAIVYACVADYYRSDKDIVRGMSCLFVRRPTFFVTLFFVTLFFSALDYTHLLACVGVPDGVFCAAYLVCSLLPLIESPERK